MRAFDAKHTFSSTNSFIHPSNHPSKHPSNHRTVHLSIYPSVRPSNHPFIHSFRPLFHPLIAPAATHMCPADSVDVKDLFTLPFIISIVPSTAYSVLGNAVLCNAVLLCNVLRTSSLNRVVRLLLSVLSERILCCFLEEHSPGRLP